MNNWKAGKADEAWKVLICGRDYHKYTEIVDGLSIILFEFSEIKGINADERRDSMFEKLSTMSGAEIVDHLKKYENVLLTSIKRGVKSNDD